MGVVYMAEQNEPVERRVALKIIKPGMDTRQVIARFEAERQALAMMDHPNIAKVLDAGTTDSGRPYFVMELVNGIPVTQYCDEQHLTAQRAAGAVHPHLPGRAARTPERASSTATSSPPTFWSRSTTAGRCPRSSTSAWPRPPARRLTEKTMFTRLRPDRRHAGVHESRAGPAEPTGHRHAQRRLFAGRRAVRAADRRHAVRQAAAALGGLRRDAADHPRGRTAQAQHEAQQQRHAAVGGRQSARSSRRS